MDIYLVNLQYYIPKNLRPSGNLEAEGVPTNRRRKNEIFARKLNSDLEYANVRITLIFSHFIVYVSSLII